MIENIYTNNKEEQSELLNNGYVFNENNQTYTKTYTDYDFQAIDNGYMYVGEYDFNSLSLYISLSIISAK